MTAEKRINKKGGRTRLSAAERRSEKIAAAVTPETWAEFHMHCEEAGMTSSDYLLGVIQAFLDEKRGAGHE